MSTFHHLTTIEKETRLCELAPEQSVSKSREDDDGNSAPSTSHKVPHDGSLQRTPTRSELDHDSQPTRVLTAGSQAGIPFSIFTKNQKRFIMLMSSWAGFFSPVSSNIYFPALNSLASDLHVSNTLINLTLTSYMLSHENHP